MPRMKRNPDGTLTWVASDWWKRLRAQTGKGRKFNALIIKISSTHALHADSARQFVDYLIRYGDHQAAWDACAPPVRHRIGVKAFIVQDAQKAVSATITATVRANEQAATRTLAEVREALKDPECTAAQIKRIIQSNAPDA